MTYKRKSGYQLKKGKSGEMRWHKKAKPKPLEGRQLRTRTGEVIYRQPSFKVTTEDLKLNTHPNQFYDSSKRLVFPGLDAHGNPDMTAPDTVFHGTRYEFKDFGDSAYHRPRSTGHWNNVLGSHFATSPDIARNFANGTVPMTHRDARSHFTQIPPGESGRVLESVVGIKNPLVIRTETDFDSYAAAFMLANTDMTEEMYDILADDYGHDVVKYVRQHKAKEDNPLKRMKAIQREIDGYMTPGSIYQSIYQYEDDLPAENGIESHTRWYAEMLNGSQGFKSYLESLGFDGLVYRNTTEGGIGVAPFDNKQIKILGEDRDEGKIVRPSSKMILEMNRTGGSFRREHKDFNDEMLRLQKEVQSAEDGVGKLNPSTRSEFEALNKARSMWARILPENRNEDGILKQFIEAHNRRSSR